MCLLMVSVLIALSVSWCADKCICCTIYTAQGDTPVLVASREGLTEALKVLIQAKANIGDRNQKAMHFRGTLVLCPSSTLDEFSSTLCWLNVQGVDTCVAYWDRFYTRD